MSRPNKPQKAANVSGNVSKTIYFQRCVDEKLLVFSFIFLLFTSEVFQIGGVYLSTFSLLCFNIYMSSFIFLLHIQHFQGC